jgi:hypothetical protein
MPSRLRSTWFIPREIHPNRVWSRPRCAGSTRSHAAPRKGMSPTSSRSARYFGQFLREQNDSHRGGRGDVRGWRHQQKSRGRSDQESGVRPQESGVSPEFGFLDTNSPTPRPSRNRSRKTSGTPRPATMVRAPGCSARQLRNLWIFHLLVAPRVALRKWPDPTACALTNSQSCGILINKGSCAKSSVVGPRAYGTAPVCPDHLSVGVLGLVLISSPLKGTSDNLGPRLGTVGAARQTRRNVAIECK